MTLFVDVTNAGTKKYRRKLDAAAEKEECPFCFATKPSDLVVEKETENWYAAENQWPYENARIHWIIIPKFHKEIMGEICLDEIDELWSLVLELIRELSLEGGGLLLRFGNPKISGATVKHLHFHLISPKIDEERKAAVVKFPIG